MGQINHQRHLRSDRLIEQILPTCCATWMGWERGVVAGGRWLNAAG